MRNEDIEAEQLLAEIIPFVRLEPIVVPERLRKDKEKAEEETKLKNILKEFLANPQSPIPNPHIKHIITN